MNINFIGISFTTLFILILFSFNYSFSQNTFVKRAGSVYSDYGVSCQPALDKGIILAAVTSTNGMDVHCGLVKTDSNGTAQWSRLFQVGQWTVPANVLQAKDEGFIVYGSATDSALLNYNHHFLFLHKTDMFGYPVWDLQFAVSPDDYAVNIVSRKLGGYLALSTGDYNTGVFPKATITRIDETGNIIWSRQFSATYGLNPQKVAEMANGNICFVSHSGSFSASPFNDIVVTLLDTGGNQIWSKNIGTYYDDEPLAVATNASNNIFITGRSIFTNRNWDTFILKMDSSGNILQSKFFDAGTPQGEIMRCIIARDDGTCTLLGDMGDFSERDIAFINLDSNAHVVSAKRYLFSPLFTNYPYEFFTDYEGGFVFTGDVRPPSALRDAIIVKTDTDGNVYCFNSNTTFSAYNDTMSSINISLNSAIPTINTRNDSSFVPNNIFYANVDCAGTTGIHNPDLSGYLIRQFYPNPVIDKITIEINEFTLIKSINIYSLEGKLISEHDLNKTTDIISIDMQSFSTGMYFLEFNFLKNSERIKIIKY